MLSINLCCARLHGRPYGQSYYCFQSTTPERQKVDGKLEFGNSIGGLATGLSSYMKDRNNRWIGWPGIVNEDLTDAEKQEITSELRKHNCSPVFLSKRQVDEFYNGYSNSLLWPLFHNLHYKQGESHDRWWKAYREVNKRFTEAILNLADNTSRIWVQDYQLLLVPEQLRVAKPRASIGFFLHIPFPDPAAFNKLPEANKLLAGVLGADLIGFHTAGYVQNFLDTCAGLKNATVEHKQVIIANRTVRVTDFPMGIDYQKYAAAVKLKAVKAAIRRYKRRFRGQRVIVAVDRMDPSKGLVERLKAYREFLKANPKLYGKVVLAMVASPSRSEVEAYIKLKKRLDSLVAEINQTFGTRKWQPIDYINESIPFEEVTALFQIADVAFIAPLRDGMNLVAKEYVASKHKKGVLILSETAGAAQELTDALLVNPAKPATVVEALEKSLKMPRRELRRRMGAMQKQLSTNTVQYWAGNFMKTLQQPVPGTEIRTKGLNKVRQRELVHDYRAASRRLILLDYDGTLVQFAENYANAAPPRSLVNLLERLSSDGKNEVVLISGRSKNDLEAWFGHLHLNLVAEHGALIRSAGHKTWHETVESGRRWKKVVRPILEKYAALTPRAKVEEKQFSLVWHYRQAPPYYANKYAVILQRVLKPIIKPYGLVIFSGSKILEIKDPDINKGTGLRRWLRRTHDFVLALGDDFTDEDTFKALKSNNYSVKVGRGRTAANYRLNTTSEVLDLLKKLH